MQRNRIQTLVDKWQPEVIVVEQNSIGSVNFEELVNAGIQNVVGFTTTHDSKNRIIESLAMDLENEEIGLIAHHELQFELQAFEYKINSSGKRIYAAPSGLHDDCIISLALTNYACSLRGVPFYVF